MHSYTTIIDGISKPFYRLSVSRFLGGGLDRFGCCKTIKNIRRYASVEGIIVKQVSANAKNTTDVVSHASLHIRDIGGLVCLRGLGFTKFTHARQ